MWNLLNSVLNFDNSHLFQKRPNFINNKIMFHYRLQIFLKSTSEDENYTDDNVDMTKPRWNKIKKCNITVNILLDSFVQLFTICNFVILQLYCWLHYKPILYSQSCDQFYSYMLTTHWFGTSASRLMAKYVKYKICVVSSTFKT